MRSVLLLLGALVALAAASSAYAENLHQRNGRGWSCAQMSYGPSYEACLKCENQNQDYDQQSATGGVCVPQVRQPQQTYQSQPVRQSPPPPPHVDTPSSLMYGAVAATLYETGSNSYVRVGVATNVSKVAAQQRALNECGKDGVPQCRIISTWTSGCGHATTGKHPVTGTLRWTSGTTASEVLARCQSGGYVCNRPVGFCLN